MKRLLSDQFGWLLKKEARSTTCCIHSLLVFDLYLVIEQGSESPAQTLASVISRENAAPFQISSSSVPRCRANVPPEAVDYGGLSGV